MEVFDKNHSGGGPCLAACSCAVLSAGASGRAARAAGGVRQRRPPHARRTEGERGHVGRGLLRARHHMIERLWGSGQNIKRIRYERARWVLVGLQA